MPLAVLGSDARAGFGQQLCQHIREDTAIPEISDLVGGIDPEHEGKLRLLPVCITDVAAEPHTWLDIASQSRDVDQLLAGQMVVEPRSSIGKDERRDTHSN